MASGPFAWCTPIFYSEFDELEQTDPDAVIIGDAADNLNYDNLNPRLFDFASGERR